MLKGLLRIRRYPQQETPHTLQKQNYSSGFSSERLTRLCGAGAPFRPLFCPVPSYIVPEQKIFPSNEWTPTRPRAPLVRLKLP